MSLDLSSPPIDFTPAGETAEQRESNLAYVEPSPGFIPVANLCCDIITKNADVTVLDYTQKLVSLRFQIDGIWQPGPKFDRESGDYMLATLKQMAGLDYQERRQKQEGKFSAIYRRQGYKFKVVSQGVATGERVAVYLDYKRPPMDTALDYGMRPKMREHVGSLLSNPEMGNVLIVGYPGEGFTSAWQAVLGCADRLTRDFVVLQPKDKSDDEEIINVIPAEYDPAKGQDALANIDQILLKQPDVLAFPDLTSVKLIDRVVDISIKQPVPVFTRYPGKHCVDGLLRLLALGVDRSKFVNRLDAVVAMRVIRKLCPNCKTAYNPPPQLLQQLGIPQGRVGNLYQPMVWKPGMLDAEENEIQPCRKCSGIGFRGRTGLFECLTLDDTIRKAIIAKPKLDYVQAVAKQQGHVSMFMEGVVMIAKGETSVDELQRVLKG
jgi:type II secretory ATPase GspE/PulE/Tfp pilus assembly ATPase PilB-like protein